MSDVKYEIELTSRLKFSDSHVARPMLSAESNGKSMNV